MRSTSLNLEGVVTGRSGAGENLLGGGSPALWQRCLCSLHAPRLVGDATQRHRACAVLTDDGGHGDQREGIGRAVADLAIDMPPGNGFGSITAVINSPGFSTVSHGVCHRAGDGSPEMEMLRPLPSGERVFHLCIQHPERDRHVAGWVAMQASLRR